MESPKVAWSWKEGCAFALCWKLQPKDPLSIPYRMHLAETLGASIVTPLYNSLDWLSHHLRKPITIVLVTLCLTLLFGIAFYYIPTFIFLGKILPAKAIRFLLFIYVEFLFFGMGCKAYGRFHNQSLIALWKKNQLIAIYPGNFSFFT